MHFKNVAVVSAAGVIASLALGAGGAYAATQIGSAGIIDNSVRSIDVKDVTLQVGDLRPSAVTKLHGQSGKDGVADVNSGASYNNVWQGDNGASLNTIVSKCDAGQVALGGGFSTYGGSDQNESGLAYDLGGDNKNIQVTVSAPYTGKGYDETMYHGGILPDRWVVKGYNNGSTNQVVRAWVVCANAN